MILLQKWNYKTHEYEPFESPAKHIAFLSDDMEVPTDCANCGKTLKYGETLTSRTIHTPTGLGFPVCDDCYDQERKDEAAAKE